MPTIQGVSDDGSSRSLDVENRGAEVYLFMHPPNNRGVGQKILIRTDALRNAIRSQRTGIAGCTPARRQSKLCRITAIPDRIEISIQTTTVEWWMEVSRTDLERALNEDGG
jgi:hypothetical protein